LFLSKEGFIRVIKFVRLLGHLLLVKLLGCINRISRQMRRPKKKTPTAAAANYRRGLEGKYYNSQHPLEEAYLRNCRRDT
jgi:hypothetical protein